MSQPLEVTDPADAKEAAEWEKAGKYMLGGAPDADDEPAESEQEAREFKYRGRTLKVDAETYDVLEGLKKEARGANGRLGSELARTRERLARMEAAIAARERPAETEPELRKPDPLLATRDINAWQEQYDAYRDAKEERRIAKLRAEYEASVAERQTQASEASRVKAWADRFYADYDHLDNVDIKPVVSQVYVEHKSELDAFGDDVTGAHERLAELAEERLVRLRKAGKDMEPPTNNDNRRRLPTFESSARGTPRSKEDNAPPREVSAASWVARERLRMTGREPRKER